MKWFDMESKFMKIEYLFPEITGIFGDHANVNILKKSIPNAEISYTSLNSRPLFLDEEINLVYMGSMTECNQKLVINRLNIFKKEIIQRINEGQNFIMGYISPVSCTSARDNKTTRYAGARRRLYPKTLPFGTIKVVQALL